MDILMEIKKLYDAGVLTKEELEAEKAEILRPISVASESKTVASNDKPQQRTSKGTLKQGLSKDTKIWLIAGSVVAVMLIIAIIIQNGRSSSNQTYDSDYYAVADTDTVMVDDTDYDTAVNDSQEQTPQSYADKAENYIGGLDTDTRVVASLTDDDRHCVYTLTEVEAGWGRVNSLYCHNLETGSTNIVNVPYKVEGEEESGEQVADAKMVGNNLYVVNTSYRCGSSVACLNTLTNNWSCAVRACADAKFVGSNKLKVTYSKLVYEGECLADNQYEYKDKVITLK